MFYKNSCDLTRHIVISYQLITVLYSLLLIIIQVPLYCILLN